jgi:hypothetical protein
MKCKPAGDSLGKARRQLTPGRGRLEEWHEHDLNIQQTQSEFFWCTFGGETTGRPVDVLGKLTRWLYF